MYKGKKKKVMYGLTHIHSQRNLAWIGFGRKKKFPSSEVSAFLLTQLFSHKCDADEDSDDNDVDSSSFPTQCMRWQERQ